MESNSNIKGDKEKKESKPRLTHKKWGPNNPVRDDDDLERAKMALIELKDESSTVENEDARKACLEAIETYLQIKRNLRRNRRFKVARRLQLRVSAEHRGKQAQRISEGRKARRAVKRATKRAVKKG